MDSHHCSSVYRQTKPEKTNTEEEAKEKKWLKSNKRVKVFHKIKTTTKICRVYTARNRSRWFLL